MRRSRPPRTRLQHLALAGIAVLVLLLGYFTGSYYRIDRLEGHGALLERHPFPLNTDQLPHDLVRLINSRKSWVILIPGEPGKACNQLLTHYIEVYNRLAAQPQVQRRLHLALLTTLPAPPDSPWRLFDWAQAYRLTPTARERIASRARIPIMGNRWCQGVQASGALVGPEATLYARLPLDKPADMAESLRLIIPTFDPNA